MLFSDKVRREKCIMQMQSACTVNSSVKLLTSGTRFLFQAPDLSAEGNLQQSFSLQYQVLFRTRQNGSRQDR
jgi:hypothetical protein